MLLVCTLKLPGTTSSDPPLPGYIIRRCRPFSWRLRAMHGARPSIHQAGREGALLRLRRAEPGGAWIDFKSETSASWVFLKLLLDPTAYDVIFQRTTPYGHTDLSTVIPFFFGRFMDRPVWTRRTPSLPDSPPMWFVVRFPEMTHKRAGTRAFCPRSRPRCILSSLANPLKQAGKYQKQQGVNKCWIATLIQYKAQIQFTQQARTTYTNP